MQQTEFEALTGKKVSAEEYAEIEKVYMAADGMDKQEFCAAWKAGKMAYIVDELVKQVEGLRKWRDAYRQKLDDADEKDEAAALTMLEFAHKNDIKELKEAAVKLVGLEMVTRLDVENGWLLSERERDYILENI